MSACICLILSLIEFEAPFVSDPGMEGSSGRETSSLSNFFLKVRTGHPLKFLKSLGRELKRIGPRVDRKLWRIVCRPADAPVFLALTKHSRPSLG